MNRQQQRLNAIACIRTHTRPAVVPAPTFKWRLVTDLFLHRLNSKEPEAQVVEIVENRALFGEVLVTLYDLNVDGFACVESARGELFISALNEVEYE